MTTIIAPRVHDLGGFQVRRAVPSLQARSVGPFVFVDHMGPALFEPGRGIDVRPHPHIGLATVTFLWAGTITHRDTLGSVQDIRPGDVNWMTAGPRHRAFRAHAAGAARARAPAARHADLGGAADRRTRKSRPAFFHHRGATPAAAARDGAWLRVVAGRALRRGVAGARCSPTRSTSRSTWTPDAEMRRRRRPCRARAVHARRRGAARRRRHSRRSTWWCSIAAPATGCARGRRSRRCCWAASRWMRRATCGGTSCPARRSASSRPSRIGVDGRFGKVPGDDEFIPLPDR